LVRTIYFYEISWLLIHNLALIRTYLSLWCIGAQLKDSKSLPSPLNLLPPKYNYFPQCTYHYQKDFHLTPHREVLTFMDKSQIPLVSQFTYIRLFSFTSFTPAWVSNGLLSPSKFSDLCIMKLFSLFFFLWP